MEKVAADEQPVWTDGQDFGFVFEHIGVVGCLFKGLLERFSETNVSIGTNSVNKKKKFKIR